MSTPKSEYLLLFRNGNWEKGLSAEELQKSVTDFLAWFERLKAQGKCKTGQPLAPTGKVLTKKGVSDGPYVEAKEAVGGYFLILASDLDEAAKIGQECPILKYGAVVEVRPVADSCPIEGKLKNLEATAMA